jgi:hypothetical protein
VDRGSCSRARTRRRRGMLQDLSWSETVDGLGGQVDPGKERMVA